jgi:hypothetical protein
MILSKFLISKKTAISIFLSLFLLFSGLFAINNSNFVDINPINASLATAVNSSIETAQVSKTDPQHDFYNGSIPVPEDKEPDAMYDLKSFSCNKNGEIILTVWGTLNALDPNMSSSLYPLKIQFQDGIQVFYINIGTYLDDGQNETRAYLMRFRFFDSTQEDDYWNGNSWVDTEGIMDSAGDNNWDLVTNVPNGTSQVNIDISDAGINLEIVSLWIIYSDIISGTDPLVHIMDDITILKSGPTIDPLILALMMSSFEQPSQIPSYPPIIIICTAFITLLVLRYLFRKKKNH